MVKFNTEQLCLSMQIIYIKINFSKKRRKNMINACKLERKMYTMED
jgi:hypothetical protein